MTHSRIYAALAWCALTAAAACHNGDAKTQPPSGEVTHDGDDESVSSEKPEPADDDGAVTEEDGPAELEVAEPGRISPRPD